MNSEVRWKRHCAGRWHRCAGAALAIALLLACRQSGAGHSVGHYPSYYPHEIRIDVVDPAAAARGLADATLHAYVGAAPKFTQPMPAAVKSVRSLKAFLVLSLDAALPQYASARDRCAAASGILAGLREARPNGLVVHPYPVTPYHADYLHHLDRVESATAAIASASPAAASVALGAEGALAEAAVKARRGAVTLHAGAVLEAVSVDALVSAARVRLAGWAGPPWIKEGWFHAYRLLAPGLGAPRRAVADRLFEALTHGELPGGFAEHVDLERRLLAVLTEGCRRVVVGYVPRQEYFNGAYPPGVENIAYDAIAGLNAPVFIRTAKLKDYPWNGELRLGAGAASRSAWNPVGGFDDPVARLMWSAIGDPAMIPFPFNASWMPNRIQAKLTRVEGRSGGIKVPADALHPEPASGRLERVGDWAFASAKVTYEVLVSPFADGTEQAVADLVYPFAFTYRWGAKPPSGGGDAYDPRVAAALAPVRERLVGLKVVRIDETRHAIAEGLELVLRTPVVEVYLNGAPRDERQVANLAPPWSTVPWHLLVLMEESVVRGYAAFSVEEARRRGVPWLDLVRDPALIAKLRALVAQFAREGFRPEALEDLVTASQARERWRALAAFAAKHGHFLVANGPYRLKSWTPDSVALEAVREITYPLGFGTFDRFVHPPRAVIETVTRGASSVIVRASAEMTLKGGRAYTLVKEPLLRTTIRGTFPLLVVSRYVLIDAAGKVLEVDKMRWTEDGHFAIDLPQNLRPGDYAIMLAVFLDGNAVAPSARIVHFRVGM